MKIIEGAAPLTPQQLGVKFWNAEYRGKTIGQWAEEAWRETLLDAPHHMPGNSPDDVLGELGLLAARTTHYVYIMQLYKLSKLLPELKPYVRTLFKWEGVYPHGRPYLKSPERLADAERLDAAIRNAAASRKAYAVLTAPEPVAPARASKTRKAKPKKAPVIQLAQARTAANRAAGLARAEEHRELLEINVANFIANRDGTLEVLSPGRAWWHRLSAAFGVPRLPRTEAEALGTQQALQFLVGAAKPTRYPEADSDWLLAGRRTIAETMPWAVDWFQAYLEHDVNSMRRAMADEDFMARAAKDWLAAISSDGPNEGRSSSHT